MPTRRWPDTPCARPACGWVLRGQRPRPDIEGEVDVSGEREAPRFTIRRLPEPPLPERRVRDFGLMPDFVDDAAEPADGAVTVLLDAFVLGALRTADYSEELEEGGFLLGLAYVDPDDGRHLLQQEHAQRLLAASPFRRVALGLHVGHQPEA